MEIEVGEYCRCKKFGRVFRYIRSFYDDMQFYVYAEPNLQLVYESEEEFISSIKHSNNIIDLIEVGDILETEQGKFEVIFDESYEKLGVLIPNRHHLEVRHSAIGFIFSEYKNARILTHEQYEQNCYKIGEVNCGRKIG